MGAELWWLARNRALGLASVGPSLSKGLSPARSNRPVLGDVPPKNQPSLVFVYSKSSCGFAEVVVSSRAIHNMERAHEPSARRTASTLTFLFPEQCESGATFTTASSLRNSTTWPPSPNSEGCRAMTSR